jgi:hypothetical protein
MTKSVTPSKPRPHVQPGERPNMLPGILAVIGWILTIPALLYLGWILLQMLVAMGTHLLAQGSFAGGTFMTTDEGVACLKCLALIFTGIIPIAIHIVQKETWRLRKDVQLIKIAQHSKTTPDDTPADPPTDPDPAEIVGDPTSNANKDTSD